MSGAPEPLTAIRKIWTSAFGSQRVAYLSGPITTGRHFLAWWTSVGGHMVYGSAEFTAALRADVIGPNEAALKAVAAILRGRLPEPIVEPASLFVSHWSQDDYLELWEQFITDHSSRILLMEGWEFSAGCASEFCRAQLDGIRTELVDGTPVVARDGIAAIKRALSDVTLLDPVPEYLAETLRRTAEKLEATLPTIVFVPGGGVPRKDESLDRLADLINVAQFVSFEPRLGVPSQAFARVLGETPNKSFPDVGSAAKTLLSRSTDGSVTGEVEDIVDEGRGPDDAAGHQARDLLPAFAERLLVQHVDAAGDGGEWIAQVVTQHGNELLAQLGIGALARDGSFGLVACVEQAALVETSLSGQENGETDLDGAACPAAAPPRRSPPRRPHRSYAASRTA